MTTDDFFDLSLEEDYGTFDPLADFGPSEDDLDAPIESGVIRAEPKEFPSAEALAQTSESLAAQPAAMRIATLLDNMQPSRKLLFALMDRCTAPQANEDVTAFIAEFQRHAKSVFTPDLILHHLHRAGALERLCEDGSSYESLNLEPSVVVEDGVEYLAPVAPPEIYWHTTADGQAALAGNRPADRLAWQLESEPQYRHLFRAVLEAAAAEDGTSEKEVAALIGDDPALEKPRMYPQRFIGKLNECDAVKWEGKRWRITDLGRAVLAEMNSGE